MAQDHTHSCDKWNDEKRPGRRMSGIDLTDHNQWNVPHGPEKSGEEQCFSAAENEQLR